MAYAITTTALRFSSPFSNCFTQKLFYVRSQSEVSSFFSSSSSSSLWRRNPRNLSLSANSIPQLGISASVTENSPLNSMAKDSSLSDGLEDTMMSYILGKRKATEVAHSVWKHVVRKGDTLIDATCGNGHDTLEMVKLVADRSRKGRVYAMDVQKVALENTLSLLDESLNSDEKECVELSAICHSNMEEVVPKGLSVRLVAFNLGYLPGGDKAIITSSETTLSALEAAKRILASRGLVSIVVYVGHPGGRKEFETVEAFASGLPVENWICCKLQMLNRPLAPVLVFLFKR